MTVVKSIDIKNNFGKISKMVYEGKRVLISRPHNQNLVLITEDEFNKYIGSDSPSRSINTVDPEVRRKALNSLHGLLEGVDTTLDEIRADRRNKYESID